MFELGLHTGPNIGFSDLNSKFGIGAGLHLRKAIDYIFSIRGDFHYGKLNMENDRDGKVESKLGQGELQLLASINNLIWNSRANRKSNFYALTGAGVSKLDMKVIRKLNPSMADVDEILTHASVGVGIAFRISDRFNIGFESKGILYFGKNSDLLDGVLRRNRDITSYSSIRLNFNIGSKNNRSEPLYWVNPMNAFMKDITELKARPVFDMTDTDGDGVIDLLDKDPNTPPGTIVDTRGIELDSDSDGIPNAEDEEPYIPKGTKYLKEKEGNDYPTRKEVDEMIDKKVQESIAKEQRESQTNWFLPIIHFNIDNHKVRFTDYGHLASVAQVLKSNPELKIVVTGFTDKTASEIYNLLLSFKRAEAAIEHLMKVHGLPRNRLVLQYSGEEKQLVPSSGSNIMNRRVEFHVAKADDKDMNRPPRT
jgi:outer membrane protein OmpA-like peptidoglycan-associated protein